MSDCFTACEGLNKPNNKYDVLIANLHNEIIELCKTSTAKFLFYDKKVAELCTYIKANLSNAIQCLISDMQLSGELDKIINEVVLNAITTLEIDVADLKNKTVGIVTPQMFGGHGDGICDDTEAINKAIKTGKPVMIPNGTYSVTNISDIENLTLFGMSKESTKIIISGNIGFSNIAKVNVEGITFISKNADYSTLFKNDNSAMTGTIKNCRFENFENVVLMPSYGNSLTVENCYFKNGVNGIELNYAHNCHIKNNIFWQQTGNSLKLSRGTGSTVANNNIVATNGKPSIFYFFSQMCTVANNYYENYDTNGEPNESFIYVQYNNASHLPKIVDNLINGDNALQTAIKFVGTGTSRKALVIEGNNVLGCENALELTPNHFARLEIKNNVGIDDICGKCYYSSEVIINNPVRNVMSTVEIDNGNVIDNFKLSVGNNTIKPPVLNKKYILRVRGDAESTAENSGIIIKLRSTNGVKLKEFVITSNNVGTNPIGELLLVDTPSANNTYYRIDYTNIPDVDSYSKLNLFIEFEEV